MNSTPLPDLYAKWMEDALGSELPAEQGCDMPRLRDVQGGCATRGIGTRGAI